MINNFFFADLSNYISQNNHIYIFNRKFKNFNIFFKNLLKNIPTFVITY